MTVLNIGGPLRDIFDGKAVTTSPGDRTLGRIISDLDTHYTGLRNTLIHRGQLSRFVNISVDGANVRSLGGLAVHVSDAATINLTFAVSGG